MPDPTDLGCLALGASGDATPTQAQMRRYLTELLVEIYQLSLEFELDDVANVLSRLDGLDVPRQ